MEVSNLVRMANRIGEFFEVMPDREEALHGVADHIQKFWEPRMRESIRACVESPEGEGEALSPFVREALQRFLFSTQS